ncbi:MAG: polyketide synthase [Verrucomicrobiae bacterium]|nr:polyketide synthase [Verrucomicrobiae bacterium]
MPDQAKPSAFSLQPEPQTAPVIKLEWLEKTIAVVSMKDRSSKNTFSRAFMDGITAVFREIASNPEARAVVVHGYDAYFCCGGSKEELLLLAQGRAKFTDFPFYDQFLRCEIPVIAAMQGHAIGAGLVFGAYADLIVLAEECLYSANFMRYGFTPGMGATCVMPKKFGAALGWEMLFSGKNYHGGELRDRGAQITVTKKADVINAALTQARDLAEKPVLALKELKRCFAESIRDELASAIRKELEMHKVTFTQPEVQKRIADLYHG